MALTNKRILVVATTDNMIWQFLIPHIKSLQEMGNVVECACAKTGFWFDELAHKFGFAMHQIGFERAPLKKQNIEAYKELKELQRNEKYDLIYCQQPVGGAIGRLLGKKFKIPVIYTAHGFHFYKGAPLKYNLIFKNIEKYLSKYTDALITINQEDYEAALKMKAKKVYKTSGIGMDFSKYVATNENKNTIRKTLNLSNKDFVVVTVAEFIERKNYPTMLKAIAETAKKNSNVKFLICGSGVGELLISNLIKTLDIENNVIVLGYRKDINRILLASDVFMLASFQEGLTLSVIEALGFGLPCVVSDVRGNRDLVDDGKGGFLAKPKDYLQFANNIQKLIDDKDLRKSMSEYNKQKSKEYLIDRVKEQMEQIYKDFD